MAPSHDFGLPVRVSLCMGRSPLQSVAEASYRYRDRGAEPAPSIGEGVEGHAESKNNRSHPIWSTKITYSDVVDGQYYSGFERLPADEVAHPEGLASDGNSVRYVCATLPVTLLNQRYSGGPEPAL